MIAAIFVALYFSAVVCTDVAYDNPTSPVVAACRSAVPAKPAPR
jgi:hypothetical protein